MPHPLLQIGPKVTALPIIHGSADCALEVRRVMLSHRFDCVAAPLPPSYQDDVETAIELLPTPSIVLPDEGPRFLEPSEWSAEFEEDEDDDAPLSYVPIDPCQGVITALRIAAGEHIAREFVDLEVEPFEPVTLPLPDAYALKQTSIERFAAAMAPFIGRLPDGQPSDRVAHMADRLLQLEQRYERILFLCSVLEWPWVREAYVEKTPPPEPQPPEHETCICQIDEATLIFMMGELPFISGLYEKARSELDDDENLSIDGVKELLLTARESYLNDFKGRARKITPLLLSQCLKYVRNLSLVERRMTPDLYTIVIAAKQTLGDQFALHVAETARNYPYGAGRGFPEVKMGVDQAQLPDGRVTAMVSRLPGTPVTWRTCELKRKPDDQEMERWKTRWNPYSQCSWPPEDDLIENFRSTVFERAKQIMGADLVKTEKFTTSVKDGIDIRDTLRHWYEGDIYVKVLPPVRGTLDCTVMLFDSPADPRRYNWRSTWYAEHEEESTLAFFATDFHDQMVGPGIGLASYGGALFLFPPVAIPDIWNDPRLDFTETLEERVLAGACLHSRCPQIALLSPLPPGAGWRRLAKRYGKRWIHVPLSQFSDESVQQLRMLHVLNGKEVRSFASHFIRRA